jgi:hypothetical protein
VPQAIVNHKNYELRLEPVFGASEKSFLVYNQRAKLAGDFLADKIRANTFQR